ncbi:4-oxalocrotonate tautomerase family protein [Tistrella mobilis]|uniref:tautomerase family protein n=1 Tax=Tistrella mobilis TaxID=171437 RepID=UPI00355701ED
MPFAKLTLQDDRISEATLQSLHGRLVELLVRILDKEPSVTSVLIERVPTECWTVGGCAVAPAAHLEVKITMGTNSKEEKAAFVSAAWRLLSEAVSGLPTATYIVIHEVPATSWGYEGITQAERKVGRNATDTA